MAKFQMMTDNSFANMAISKEKNSLKERSKDHKKAKGKVNVQRLHVGNLWQSPKQQGLFLRNTESHLLTAPMSVTMVRTVVTPRPTLAGAEPRSR